VTLVRKSRHLYGLQPSWAIKHSGGSAKLPHHRIRKAQSHFFQPEGCVSGVKLDVHHRAQHEFMHYLASMTRDIIETDGFIVVVEYSVEDKTVLSKCEVNERAVGFAFYGSGDVQLEMKCKDHREHYKNTSGIAISFFGDCIEFTHTISPKIPLQSITVFSTLRNLEALPEQEKQFFRERLGILVSPENDFVRGPHMVMTPDMTGAVAKVFACTYTGATRLMFLKSQVTELLSHFIANCASASSPHVDEQEREKLYQAKAILSDNIAAPPSLNELSKVIGLNSYKLKKNFKELFGVPVFKHLQNERLNKAHNLLRDGKMTVQEASWAVGYDSVSSFSNAFAKKFGFRPSDVKK
jgi:AraC family transcriptional regulator, transcriptional activator of the genes for pyochelin and ferripyochelin receptors